MTEAEWLACEDPEAMLKLLRGKVSDRKLRLFSAACVRRVWKLLGHAGSREAVDAAERFADSQASTVELSVAREIADLAQSEAHDVEYAAEADANFCITAEYCAASARLFAADAARVAVSARADEPDRERDWE